MKKVVAYILISATLFSTMEVVLKIAGNHLDAFQITFIRFLIGGVFLLPFALAEIKRRNTEFTKKDWLHMTLMGIVCICISMVFFHLGVQNSHASTAAVIFCVNPLFTMFFAHFITVEKLNKNKVIALSIGLVGMVFMINPFNMDPGNTLIGVTYSFLAALTFGLYSAMGRITVHRLGGVTQTSISFVLGSVAMVPILLVLDKPIFSGINSGNILMVLYFGIMITGIGYLTYFLVMGKSDAATASIVFFVKPALAPIIAVIVLREVISFSGMIGIVLIFIGSYINLREQKQKAKKVKADEVTDN